MKMLKHWVCRLMISALAEQKSIIRFEFNFNHQARRLKNKIVDNQIMYIIIPKLQANVVLRKRIRVAIISF